MSPEVKHARSKQLLDLSDRKLSEFYEAHIGTTADVLFEHTRKGNRMYGFTANYIKTEAPYDAKRVNRITPVRLERQNPDGTALTATLID